MFTVLVDIEYAQVYLRRINEGNPHICAKSDVYYFRFTYFYIIYLVGKFTDSFLHYVIYPISCFSIQGYFDIFFS